MPKEDRVAYQSARAMNEHAGAFFARGKYAEANNRWMRAVKSLDAARLLAAFTGLEHAGTEKPVRPALAAVLARLHQPAEAWQQMEAT